MTHLTLLCLAAFCIVEFRVIPLVFLYSLIPLPLQFLKTLRPSFEKRMPSQCRKWLASDALNEIFAATVDVTAEMLDRVPGMLTISVDGHVDGRGRSVHTVALCKLGITAFEKCTWLGSRRHTGSNLAQILEDVIKDNPDKIVAVVADNTSSNLTMFEQFQESEDPQMKHMFVVGCIVHIMDLLIEEICKIKQITECLAEAHFLVSFLLGHKLLHEEFMILRDLHKVECHDLVLFPATRFAYAYLMCRSVLEAFALFSFLLETTVFKESVAAASRRGNEGKKAQSEFVHFKNCANNVNDFKGMLKAVVTLLLPFSVGLHYLEGDDVPSSHAKPIYSVLLRHVHALPEEVTEHLSASTLEDVVSIVNTRWIPPEGSRKVGMKGDVIEAAFAMDPYAIAVTPESLFNSDVTAARNRTFTKLARGDAQMEGLFAANLVLYQSRTNTVFDMPLKAAESLAKSRMEAGLVQLYEADPSSHDNVMRKTVTVLKCLPRPCIFWGSLLKERAVGWNAENAQSHLAFCHSAIKVLNIVVHSCATERYGKGYDLIHTCYRTSLEEQRLNRLLYVYFNYPLCHGPSLVPALSLKDFLRQMLSPEEKIEIEVCFSTQNLPNS
jgi:Protein of unknown function (DUF 659)